MDTSCSSERPPAKIRTRVGFMGLFPSYELWQDPNMPHKFDKAKLPSRFITDMHGSEGRRTMLENLKTASMPEGMGPHLDKPFVCVVDTGNESAPCNSEL